MAGYRVKFTFKLKPNLHHGSQTWTSVTAQPDYSTFQYNLHRGNQNTVVYASMLNVYPAELQLAL